VEVRWVEATPADIGAQSSGHPQCAGCPAPVVHQGEGATDSRQGGVAKILSGYFCPTPPKKLIGARLHGEAPLRFGD
jgi:hypothetical protein